MSSYTPIVNYAAKDALASGNPSKKILGTEITAELNAISTAIGSKADLASPTFTGTPAAPTAAAQTNTTQLATTAFANLAVANLVNTTAVNGWALPAANAPALFNNSVERLRFVSAEAMLPGSGAARGWGGTFRPMEFGSQGSSFFGRTDSPQIGFLENLIFTGSQWQYVNTAAGASALMAGGAFTVSTVPSGTSGTAATPTAKMSIGNTGTTSFTGPAAGTVISATDGTIVGYVAGFQSTIMRWGASTNHPAAIVTNDLNRISVAAAGNVTVNAPSSGVALTVTGAALTTSKTVAFSATPTFNASDSNYFDFGALTAAVTSMTVTNPTGAQSIIIRLKQDGTGGRTVAVPSGAKVAGTTSGTANQISLLSMTYNPTDARWEGAFSTWN